MRCTLCGHEFDPDTASSACEDCGLAKSCDLVACPNCGFELPPSDEGPGFLEKIKEFFEGVGDDQ